MKIAISHLIAWVMETASTGQYAKALNSAVPQLNHITEASNALVILPNATDFTIDHMATFPTLNLAQIKHIIDTYTPDKYAHHMLRGAALCCRK